MSARRRAKGSVKAAAPAAERQGDRQPGAERSDGDRVSRATLLAVAGVFCLALVVRGAYLIDIADYPAARIAVGDSLNYDTAARQLANDGGMSTQFFWQPFFYPFFLAGVYSAGVSSVLGVKVVQLVLGALTCALTCALGARVFGRGCGLLAGVITAFYGPLIFYQGELLAAGWAAFWSVVLILLFLAAGRRHGLFVCLLLGVCGALSMLTRPTFVPFLLAACVWLGHTLLRSPSDWPRRLTSCAAVVVGFVLIAMPVAFQNLRLTGKFGILPFSGGVNLYIGNHPDPCVVEKTFGFEWRELQKRATREEGITDPWLRQRYFNKLTRAYVAEDPLRLVGRLGSKALQLVGSREIPRDVDVYVARRWSILLSLLTWKAHGFGFPFGVLLPLALVGLVCCWRKMPAPVLLFIVLYPLAVVLVFVTARYRVAAVPVLATLAGAGCVAIVDMVRRGRWPALALAAAGCVGVVLLASVPKAPCQQRRDMEAVLYKGVGAWYAREGDVSAALEWSQRAIDLDPNLVEAQVEVGRALVDQGQFDEALEHFEQALRVKPHVVEMHMNCGILLRRANRLRAAEQHFRAALRLDQSFVDAHAQLAIVLAGLGRLEEALAEQQTAARLSPDDAQVHFMLGLVLHNLGRLAEAAEAYRTTLRLDPHHAHAGNSLRESHNDRARRQVGSAHAPIRELVWSCLRT